MQRAALRRAGAKSDQKELAVSWAQVINNTILDYFPIECVLRQAGNTAVQGQRIHTATDLIFLPASANFAFYAL